MRINAPVISQVFANNPPNVVINTTANTALVTNRTVFSDWTLAQAVPTAATATVSGRVLTTSGRGVNRARLSLTDSNGQIRWTTTNPFGFYRFVDLPTGAEYVLRVGSKSYQFNEPSRILSLDENLEGENFTALP
jgi:hypothetical protein